MNESLLVVKATVQSPPGSERKHTHEHAIRLQVNSPLIGPDTWTQHKLSHHHGSTDSEPVYRGSHRVEVGFLNNLQVYIFLNRQVKLAGWLTKDNIGVSPGSESVILTPPKLWIIVFHLWDFYHYSVYEPVTRGASETMFVLICSMASVHMAFPSCARLL